MYGRWTTFLLNPRTTIILVLFYFRHTRILGVLFSEHMFEDDVSGLSAWNGFIAFTALCELLSHRNVYRFGLSNSSPFCSVCNTRKNNNARGDFPLYLVCHAWYPNASILTFFHSFKSLATASLLATLIVKPANPWIFYLWMHGASFVGNWGINKRDCCLIILYTIQLEVAICGILCRRALRIPDSLLGSAFNFSESFWFLCCSNYFETCSFLTIAAWLSFSLTLPYETSHSA